MPIILGIIILAALIVLGVTWIIIEHSFIRRTAKPAFFGELKALADEGVLQARYVLAKCYPQFIADPKHYMAQTAELGHMDAQMEMMKRLMKGTVFSKNSALALDWAKKAAEQGSVVARHQLSLMYQKGVGVEKDLLPAYYWLLMALQVPVRKAKLLPREDILKFQKSKDKKVKALWRLHLEDWATYRDEVSIQNELIKEAASENLEKKLTAEEIKSVQSAVSERQQEVNNGGSQV